jgi:glutamine synthetase
VDTVTPPQQEHRQLATDLASQGVEYAVGGWIDVLGRSKSKMVPIDHLPSLLAGSERYTPRGMGRLGEMTPHEDEVVALPDPATLTVLPFDRRVAWMAADMWFGGREPFALCPRSILKHQIARAAEAGYEFQIGVETEFYAYRPATPGATFAAPPTGIGASAGFLEPLAMSGRQQPTPAYDLEHALDALVFLDPMVRAMQESGFGVFSFDAEGGHGQYEFDFSHAPALEMADRLSLFRLMARQIAKQAGLAVTFMPKPYTAAWGSGHHVNMSLTDLGTGENLFRTNDGLPASNGSGPAGAIGDGGWTKLAACFVGGILAHAPAIAAIANPTVNSYKRLTPRLTDGSVSWAPVWAAYGDNNRSCLLRLPRNRPCVENRGVDSAANAYLVAAFLLAAGLEGIAAGTDPGEPVSEMTYDWTAAPPGSARLPRNLQEAIDAFTADPLTAEVFPARFVQDYAAMKQEEWDSYHAQVSDWERDRYLADL